MCGHNKSGEKNNQKKMYRNMDENKSIGEDLFFDTKSESDFSSLNIQNIAD